MNTTGERIRKLRKEFKYTQEDLADRLGITKQTVYKYEKGIITTIPTKTILEMASIFKVSPEYILGYTDEPYKIEEDEERRKWLEEQMEIAKNYHMIYRMLELMSTEERKKLMLLLEISFPQYINNNDN